MTKQRAAILDIIRSDKAHHTADEIFRLARQRLPGISLATVYNNLRVLEDMGLIRRITAERDADRYDGSFIPHGHVVCEECGKMWDFNVDGLDGLLSEAIGSEYSSYELKVRSLCDRCRRNKDF